MPKATASNEVQADRLVGLSEWARAVGRTSQADHFLLLALTAFEGGELPV